MLIKERKAENLDLPSAESPILLEAQFPLGQGGKIPSVNGYLVDSALLNQPFSDWVKTCPHTRINSIAGSNLCKNRMMRLETWSRLQLRVPIERAGSMYDWAGQSIQIDGRELQLGVPEIFTLTPKPCLKARFVCFSPNSEFPLYDPAKPDPELFLAIASHHLRRKGINGIARLQWNKKLNRWNQAIQKIKGVTIPGFTLIVEGLSDEDSIKLQSVGLGLKRRMGGGWFC